MSKDFIRWEALEYEHREKSNDWYWAIGVITFCVALTAIILSNYIFSIVVIVSGFALSVSSSRKPRLASFELKKTGITINSHFTPYGSLKSFWVENNSHTDGTSKVIFKPKKSSSHLLVLPIEEYDPEEIRDYLLDMLMEEELEEPLSQKIAEYFGF